MSIIILFLFKKKIGRVVKITKPALVPECIIKYNIIYNRNLALKKKKNNMVNENVELL